MQRLDASSVLPRFVMMLELELEGRAVGAAQFGGLDSLANVYLCHMRIE